MLKVRSLSPAYWYVCNVERAKRDKCRGQVSQPFGSRAEAERELKRLALG